MTSIQTLLPGWEQPAEPPCEHTTCTSQGSAVAKFAWPPETWRWSDNLRVNAGGDISMEQAGKCHDSTGRQLLLFPALRASRLWRGERVYGQVISC